MRKQKKTTRQKQEEQLDKLWAKLIRDRDGRCWKCGSTEKLHANHIISRRHKSTRFDLDNGFTLCEYHHLFWWHSKNPKTGKEAWDWFESMFGTPGFPVQSKKYYDWLIIKSRQTWHGDLYKWEIYLKNHVMKKAGLE